MNPIRGEDCCQGPHRYAVVRLMKIWTHVETSHHTFTQQTHTQHTQHTTYCYYARNAGWKKELAASCSIELCHISDNLENYLSCSILIFFWPVWAFILKHEGGRTLSWRSFSHNIWKSHNYEIIISRETKGCQGVSL